MKYYSIFFVITTSILLSVTGKIPDYIHICKRNDPQINECILEAILSLRHKLVEGIPELAVNSIDPLYLKKLSLNLGPGFKAEGHDLLVTGGRNFKIEDLIVDIKANTYTFAISIPEIVANGTYEVDTKIASIPLKGKGPIHLIGKSVTGRGTLYGKHVNRHGNTHNYFPSMSMKLNIDDYNIRLENLFEGDPTIGEVTNKLLNEEKAEIISSMLPSIEKALIEYFIESANNVVKTFTWDELFPVS